MRPITPFVLAAALAAAAGPGLAAAQDSPAPRAETAAQPLDDTALFDTIAALDTALFTAAFVSCDVARVRALVTDDLEFYDDRSGLAYTGGDAFTDDINCLHWTQGNDPQIARRLVPGSMTVDRLGDWGAMQRGLHQFYRVVPGGTNVLEGDADFIHLWRRDADGWKIARVISYGHRAAASGN